MKKKILSLLFGLLLTGQAVKAVDNDVALGVGTTGFGMAMGIAYSAAKSLSDSRLEQWKMYQEKDIGNGVHRIQLISPSSL